MTFFKRSFIVFILVFSSLVLSEEIQYESAYIGIAGPSEGAGMMGHMFLVFAEKSGQFLNSVAYQYAVKFPENFEFTAMEAARIGSLPFIVTKLPGWGFIKTYNSEGRYIHLFELKLTLTQVTKMRENVEADMKARESLEFFDYSVPSNNCATQVYDHVNAILGKNAIPYSPPTSAIFNFSFIRPKTVAVTIPLSAAAILGNNPIVSNTIKFRSDDMAALESNIVGARELRTLSESCNIDSKTFDTVLTIFGNRKLRETESYLNLLNGLFSKCLEANSSGQSSFNFHLDFIRYVSRDMDFIDMVGGFYK